MTDRDQLIALLDSLKDEQNTLKEFAVIGKTKTISWLEDFISRQDKNVVIADNAKVYAGECDLMIETQDRDFIVMIPGNTLASFLAKAQNANPKQIADNYRHIHEGRFTYGELGAELIQHGEHWRVFRHEAETEGGEIFGNNVQLRAESTNYQTARAAYDLLINEIKR